MFSYYSADICAADIATPAGPRRSVISWRSATSSNLFNTI